MYTKQEADIIINYHKTYCSKNNTETIPEHCKYCDNLTADRCDSIEYYCDLQGECPESASDCKLLRELLPVICLSCLNLVDCIFVDEEFTLTGVTECYNDCFMDCMDDYLAAIGA
jgi:hypothetical protein